MTMLQVDFHFNSPDKDTYLCRLLRKASAQGKRVGVLGPEELINKLGQTLWQLKPSDFVSHCQLSDPPHQVKLSSVLLSPEWAELTATPKLDAILSLSELPPPDFKGVARLIEVVGPQETDKASARQRWKHYTQLGFTIHRHDLSVPAAALLKS